MVFLFCHSHVQHTELPVYHHNINVCCIFLTDNVHCSPSTSTADIKGLPESPDELHQPGFPACRSVITSLKYYRLPNQPFYLLLILSLYPVHMCFLRSRLTSLHILRCQLPIRTKNLGTSSNDHLHSLCAPTKGTASSTSSVNFAQLLCALVVTTFTWQLVYLYLSPVIPTQIIWNW